MEQEAGSAPPARARPRARARAQKEAREGEEAGKCARREASCAPGRFWRVGPTGDESAPAGELVGAAAREASGGMCFR